MSAIDGYADLTQIGSGGTAVVYRATQTSIGREVALKVMVGHALDARTSKRFQREAQALGRLGWHPNIVALFDAGVSSQGTAYIAMEYLPGGSLAEGGRLSAQEATAVGVRVAGALHCAHEAGVLHRDVKPANILRDPFGGVKLADFGISGLVDATHTTGGGMTLAHVAPEVVDGNPADIRSDVYSLASTLFELITARPPFFAESMAAVGQLLMAIMDDPVPDLRPWGAPNELAETLERAMAKRPQTRPQNAAALGRLLQQVQQANNWQVTDLPVPQDPAARRGPALTDQDTQPL